LDKLGGNSKVKIIRTLLGRLDSLNVLNNAAPYYLSIRARIISYQQYLITKNVTFATDFVTPSNISFQPSISF
jgi:hypothetical protein